MDYLPLICDIIRELGYPAGMRDRRVVVSPCDELQGDVAIEHRKEKGIIRICLRLDVTTNKITEVNARSGMALLRNETPSGVWRTESTFLYWKNSVIWDCEKPNATHSLRRRLAQQLSLFARAAIAADGGGPDVFNRIALAVQPESLPKGEQVSSDEWRQTLVRLGMAPITNDRRL